MPDSTHGPSLAALAALATLLLTAVSVAPAAARQTLTGQQIQEYNSASLDTARAEWVATQLRNFLASDPDSTHAVLARRILVRTMFTLKAPSRQIVAQIDSAARLLPNEPQVVVFYYGQLSQDLMDRGMEPAKALEYAHRSSAAIPNDPQFGPLRGMVHGVLGRAQLGAGRADSAVTTLKVAVLSSPDSQKVLVYLGQAYEKTKKPDLAINAYTRSLAVYAGRDTSAAAPLRDLWRKKNGSLAGLDQHVEKARAASRQSIALDSRREVWPAPSWSLTYLDGKPVSSDDFKGKVVVLDFWGSWCGPCRVELPIFQAVYERYKDKGVAFLGMNYERPQPGRDPKQLARDYMAKNNLTFPTVVDHESVAANAYKITGYPTVFMIDKTGMVRYKNVGVSDGIEMILQDQIESLLK
jgi:thiol-disulfide isomerase/thioredoxin